MGAQAAGGNKTDAGSDFDCMYLSIGANRPPLHDLKRSPN